MKADQERLKHLDARLVETAEVVEGMKHRMADLESDMKPDRKGDVSQNKVRHLCVLWFRCVPREGRLAKVSNFSVPGRVRVFGSFVPFLHVFCFLCVGVCL